MNNPLMGQGFMMGKWGKKKLVAMFFRIEKTHPSHAVLMPISFILPVRNESSAGSILAEQYDCREYFRLCTTAGDWAGK